MRFGDPIGGQHLLLSKKQWRSYQLGKGDRGVVCRHGSKCNDEDNNSNSDTSVRSGRNAGKKKGKCYKPITVVSMATTRPSATTGRKKCFSHWQMNIQHCCDED
jgi:hypothetical protein